MRSIRETARRMAGFGAVLWCGLGAGMAQAEVDCEAMRGNLTRAVEFLDPLAEDYGVFSAGSSARLKKQIGKVRDTAAASADLAALCAALQQREQPQRDHGCADDAGRGAHQHTDADDAECHAATKISGEVADHIEQIVGES